MVIFLSHKLRSFHLLANLNQKYPSSSSTPPRALLSLPYIQGTIDHIVKILDKKNTKIMFKPHKTLKQLFRIEKDISDPMLVPGVY
jgi:hypothetical protein